MSITTQRTAPAGTWALDPIHSSATFAVRHAGASTFRGGFDTLDGALVDGVLTGAVDVDSVAVKLADLKGHLLSPDFFDAANHGQVSFRSTDIRIAEDNSVELDGELTIRGTTRPITATGQVDGPFEGPAGKQVIAFDLETTIDRRDYGLNWQMALPNGRDALGYDVTLTVTLELGQQG